ncbi:MAG: YggT family protein [Anaerolineae bacterium]|nr:YggT family protein [Anaerolineae bacterium]
MSFLINFVNLFFQILQLAILVRIILSWFRVDPYNPFMQILYQITEPVLEPFRRVIPPIGMIDITPIVALLVLRLVQRIIVTMLLGLL